MHSSRRRMHPVHGSKLFSLLMPAFNSNRLSTKPSRISRSGRVRTRRLAFQLYRHRRQPTWKYALLHPHLTSLLTLNSYSTSPRRQRRSLEALSGRNILQLPHPPNLHRSRRSPWRHPIRTGASTRRRRAGDRTQGFRRIAFHREHVCVSEVVEGHCGAFGWV
jgi:hypothetical protein